MSYRIAITTVPEFGSASVRLWISLTRVESNELFLSGDSMLAWPAVGLERGVEHGSDSGLERSGMFISEVAARSQGLEIRYSEMGQAERAAALLCRQLADAGIEEGEI